MIGLLIVKVISTNAMVLPPGFHSKKAFLCVFVCPVDICFCATKWRPAKLNCVQDNMTNRIL